MSVWAINGAFDGRRRTKHWQPQKHPNSFQNSIANLPQANAFSRRHMRFDSNPFWMGDTYDIKDSDAFQHKQTRFHGYKGGSLPTFRHPIVRSVDQTVERAQTQGEILANMGDMLGAAFLDPSGRTEVKKEPGQVPSAEDIVPPERRADELRASIQSTPDELMMELSAVRIGAEVAVSLQSDEARAGWTSDTLLQRTKTAVERVFDQRAEHVNQAVDKLEEAYKYDINMFGADERTNFEEQFRIVRAETGTIRKTQIVNEAVRSVMGDFAYVKNSDDKWVKSSSL